MTFNQIKNTRVRESGKRHLLPFAFDDTLKSGLSNSEITSEDINGENCFIYTLDKTTSQTLLNIRSDVMTKDNIKPIFSDVLENTKKDICRFIVVRYFAQEKKNGNIAVSRIAYDKQAKTFLLNMSNIDKQAL